MSAAPSSPASDAEFLSGRDLAARMLRHLQSVGDGDHASIEARYRYDGRPQDNAAMPYLRELVAHPALVEGFSAVLSDGFFAGGFADADVYARLSISEMRGPSYDAGLQKFLASVTYSGPLP